MKSHVKSGTNPIKARVDECKDCNNSDPEYLIRRYNKIQREIIEPKGKRLTRYAKENRNKETVYEKLLFEKLDKKGFVCIPQYPIYDSKHSYIADMYLPVYSGSRGIVVEVDGDYHKSEDMIIRDKNRDDYMHLRGYIVIRITNEQVDKRLDDIIELIIKYDPKRKIDKKSDGKDHTIRLK